MPTSQAENLPCASRESAALPSTYLRPQIFRSNFSIGTGWLGTLRNDGTTFVNFQTKKRARWLHTTLGPGQGNPGPASPAGNKRWLPHSHISNSCDFSTSPKHRELWRQCVSPAVVSDWPQLGTFYHCQIDFPSLYSSHITSDTSIG